MRHLNEWFILLSCATMCAGQTCNILGVVRNNADVGISGATVKLEKAGISTTTGADGSFSLSHVTGIQHVATKGTPLAPSLRFGNDRITFTLPENKRVAISIHDVRGRKIYNKETTYKAGEYILRLPVQRAGMLLYRMTIGNEAYSFKSSFPGISASVLEGVSAGVSTLVRQAKAAAVIADVICVVKEGQLTYRDSIWTSDTSGLLIKMIPNAGNVTDADGNTYQSVKIGNQVWTVENLRTTKFKDGTSIPLVTEAGAWATLNTPGYCFNEKSITPAERQKWGALYNWYAINTGKLAPAGWHVPTNADWSTLENYLIANGYNWDKTTTGNMIAKSLAAKTDWAPFAYDGTPGNDLSTNNTSGFSATPGGCRFSIGYFILPNNHGYWWSATTIDESTAYYRDLTFDSGYLGESYWGKRYGFSIRLLRD